MEEERDGRKMTGGESVKRGGEVETERGEVGGSWGERESGRGGGKRGAWGRRGVGEDGAGGKGRGMGEGGK